MNRIKNPGSDRQQEIAGGKGYGTTGIALTNNDTQCRHINITKLGDQA